MEEGKMGLIAIALMILGLGLSIAVSSWMLLILIAGFSLLQVILWVYLNPAHYGRKGSARKVESGILIPATGEEFLPLNSAGKFPLGFYTRDGNITVFREYTSKYYNPRLIYHDIPSTETAHYEITAAPRRDWMFKFGTDSKRYVEPVQYDFYIPEGSMCKD